MDEIEFMNKFGEDLGRLTNKYEKHPRSVGGTLLMVGTQMIIENSIKEDEALDMIHNLLRTVIEAMSERGEFDEKI